MFEEINFSGIIKKDENKLIIYKIFWEWPYENYLEKTFISKEEAMNEYIMLGLRLTSGISKSKFFERFNINIKEKFKQIDQLIQENLLIEKDDFIFIPEDLFYISNYIITKII